MSQLKRHSSKLDKHSIYLDRAYKNSTIVMIKWLTLQNIYFSDRNESLTFKYIVFYPLSPTRSLLDLTKWVIRRKSYKKHKLFTLREKLSSRPVFLGPCRIFYFCFLCCVLFRLSLFRVLYVMLYVLSIRDCSFDFL